MKIKKDKYGYYIEDVVYNTYVVYRPLGDTKFNTKKAIICGQLNQTKTRPTKVMGVNRTARGVYDEYWPLMLNRLHVKPSATITKERRENAAYINMISMGMTRPDPSMGAIPFIHNKEMPKPVRVMGNTMSLYVTQIDNMTVKHNASGYPAVINQSGRILFMVRGYAIHSVSDYIKASGLSDEIACYLVLKFGDRLPTNLREFGVENVLPEDRLWIRT